MVGLENTRVLIEYAQKSPRALGNILAFVGFFINIGNIV